MRFVIKTLITQNPQGYPGGITRILVLGVEKGQNPQKPAWRVVFARYPQVAVTRPPEAGCILLSSCLRKWRSPGPLMQAASSSPHVFTSGGRQAPWCMLQPPLLMSSQVAVTRPPGACCSLLSSCLRKWRSPGPLRQAVSA